MRAIVLIALCFVLATSIQQYNFDIATANNYDYESIYQFTTTTTATVTFSLTFPVSTGTTPTTFTIQVYSDNAGTTSVQGPTTLTVPASGTVSDATWTSVAAGTYYLYIRSTDAVASLVPVQIDIKEGAATVFTNAPKVDVLRSAKLYRYVYLAASGPLVVTNTVDAQLAFVNLYPITGNYVFGTVVPSSGTAGQTGTYYDVLNTRTYTLTAGYYALEYSSPTAAMSSTYQSDTYACPSFITNHTDDYNIFEPCTFQTTLSASAKPYIDRQPVFELRTIAARQVIEIQLNFELPLSNLPASFFIEVLDEAGDPLTHQPKPFGTGASTPAATPISASASPYNIFWTAPYAGNFFLRITAGVTPIATLQMYYLTVTRANGGTLVQAVDVLRETNSYLKYINFEAVPQNIYLTNTELQSNIFLYSVTSPPTVTTTPVGFVAGSTSDPFKHYTTSLANGYYLAEFKETTPGSALTIGYNSDPYPCPYDTTSAYVDLRGVFSNCVGSSNTAAPPLPTPSTIPVYGDSIMQLPKHDDTFPRYHLGTLLSADVLTILLKFKIPTNAAFTQYTIRLVEQVTPDTFTTVATQPTVTSSTTEAFNAAITITESSNYVLTATYTLPAANSNLYLEIVSADASTIASFRIYQLVVNRQSGTTVSSLLSGTDILRNSATFSTTDKLYNLIYLDRKGDLTVRHSDISLVSTNIVIFPMVSTDFLMKSSPDATASTPSGNTKIYTSLDAGWYGIEIQYDATATNYGSVSYQSNAYNCPYSSGINDTRGAFDPCTGSIVDGATNAHQAYVIQAHGCGPAQFFNGTCNNVDPAKNCNTFNALSGDCTTCPSTKYTLASGSCTIPPTCSAGSTLVGVVCVSDLCATSNANGTCASCKSVLNEVKADGSCGLKVCPSSQVLNQTSGNCDAVSNNCQPGYFEVGTDCYKLGPNCTALSPFLTCASCDPGFKVELGGCVPCRGANSAFPCATCPDRFFVDTQGGCSPVSTQCATFNPTNGLCTACRSGDPVNGVCCPSGQTATASGCVNSGGQGTNVGGSLGVSFLSSAFFDFCGDIDRQKQVCNSCKPGYTFVAGNLCG